MRFQFLQVLLFTAAYAQIYDLSFDGAAVISLLWSLDSNPASTYNFYLCAGDETTDSYVCERQSCTYRTLIDLGHSITSHHEWSLCPW